MHNSIYSVYIYIYSLYINRLFIIQLQQWIWIVLTSNLHMYSVTGNLFIILLQLNFFKTECFYLTGSIFYF